MELREPIPVSTPLGDGHAIIFHDGFYDNYWTVVLKNSAIVTFKQPELRVKRNYSLGINMTADDMRKLISS